MDAEKRKIIVSEIDHWRKSRLLPEQYCDFLLNLYMDDHMERTKTWLGMPSEAIAKSQGKHWMTIFGLIGLVCFLLLHFTSFVLPVQVGLIGLFVVVLFLGGAAQREKRPLVSYLCFGSGAVLLLVSGLYLCERAGMQGIPVVAFIAFCSLVWMMVGILARMSVFHFCGWAVLFLIYAWVLRQNIDSFDWAGLQMSWVPVSLVLVWLGWLFHHVNKQVAAVLLAVGVLGWFAAEVYGMAVTDIDFASLQASLLGKIAAAGAVLFALRKKWIEWVVE